ncbi:hypothetical protein C1645_739499 [Glomus cerebriforme]|uniref:Uncharacterized protein n=1 Tax=Glomus cerebriforme TaxID=658196 RepID=A0A397SWX0_9GLOM|nr:hypothetical protein C1645_739499 [Glomus cerebriforme]
MSENNDNTSKSKTLNNNKNFDNDNEKLDVEKDQDKPKWYEAHRIAIQNNQHFYIDPETGYKVMTELYHKSRGYCCGNKCRHCPFNYENVGKKINIQGLINDDDKITVDNNNEKKIDNNVENVENKNNKDN